MPIGQVTGDEADSQLVAEVQQSVGPFQELGVTGLRRNVGYLDEEFLPQLKGRKAVQVYREMSENSPIVGALLFTMENLLRQVQWRVEPAGKNKDSAKAAEFLESCMDDMSHSWSDFVAEALSCLTYGWSMHEIVYKRRMSPWATDVRQKSRHTDGLVGWRKLPVRSQDTLFRWVFDPTGDVVGMIQMAPPLYQQTTIPMKRALLFRNRPRKNSPEGSSILRNAYRPWFYVKRLEEFESIGVERDLAGLPVAKVPAEYLRAKPGTEMAKTVESFRKMIKSLRRNEQEGVVFPLAYDQDTKQPLYTLELLGGGGGRAFNTDAIIQRHEQRMLMTVLADFIMVGHQGTGTYNLHVDKTGIFRNALRTVMDQIVDVMNRQAVPRLFLANGWKPEKLPEFKTEDVDSPDITALGSFMSQMANLGVNWFPDGDMEKFVRAAARLPELSDDEYQLREQEGAQSEQTRYMQSMSQYLQAKMMADNPEAAMQPQGGPGAPAGQAGPQAGQPG